MPTPELSVVVLCYRAEDLAEEYVGKLSKELEDEHIDYELILVANYMPNTNDKTPEIVRKLAEKNPRFKVVAMEKKGMMGWDLRSGLEAATGSNIATIDGDGQMPSSDVIRVYRLLQTSNYDLIKTYRTQRNDGFSRWLISFLFNLVFRLLFWKGNFHDINSKPKVMKREVYAKMHLISDDWFTDTEIMIEILQYGMRVKEIPTVFYKNERRLSFVHYTAIGEFVRNLLYYRFVRFPPFKKVR
jgi:glycosyltransferase involved in cell wall biosynthesis